jgi:hypothetical protein
MEESTFTPAEKCVENVECVEAVANTANEPAAAPEKVAWTNQQKQEVDKMLVELRYKERLRQMKLRRAGPPPPTHTHGTRKKKSAKQRGYCTSAAEAGAAGAKGNECGDSKCKAKHTTSVRDKTEEEKTTFSVSGAGTEFEEIKFHLDD